MRVLSFVIAFITLTPVPWAAGDRTVAGMVRFERLGDGGIIVPVTIDGRGPFRFLLDTGSSHSAVSAALAADLALRPVARTLVTTPVGETWRAVVRVRSLALASLFVLEIQPSVFDGQRLAGGLPVGGVLGQDVLAGLSYTLDYPRRRLSWGGPSASDGTRVRLPLEWDDGCPIVKTAPADGRRALRLIPDSGASHVVLFDRGDGALPPHQDTGTSVGVGTLDAERAGRAVLIPALRIGEIVLLNQRGAVIDADGRRADGVLPLHGFDRVTFDGPGGYLQIERR
jgi:predicted aspartyl protease